MGRLWLWISTKKSQNIFFTYLFDLNLVLLVNILRHVINRSHHDSSQWIISHLSTLYCIFNSKYLFCHLCLLIGDDVDGKEGDEEGEGSGVRQRSDERVLRGKYGSNLIKFSSLKRNLETGFCGDFEWFFVRILTDFVKLSTDFRRILSDF